MFIKGDKSCNVIKIMRKSKRYRQFPHIDNISTIPMATPGKISKPITFTFRQVDFQTEMLEPRSLMSRVCEQRKQTDELVSHYAKIISDLQSAKELLRNRIDRLEA